MQKKFWWTALMTPLVIAPIAIVASCGSGTSSNNDANGDSNDKPNNDANGGSDNTTPVFSIKTDVTLIGLYPSESNPEQYNDPEKLMTLLFDYKKQIFNNPAYGLVYKFQIRLGQIKINIPDGSISFKVKIISPNDPNTDLIPVTDVTLRGFSKIPFQSIVFKSNTPWLSLSDSEKDPFQYMENKAKLIRLIVEKKNEIFEKFPSDLWDDQIEIVGDPEIFINSMDTTYLFCQIKIKNNFDANAPILLEPTKIGLYGFENKFSRNGVSADLKTLTTEQRDAAQYVDDKAKLIKLIAEKKNEIFGNWSNNLISNEKQIEIVRDVNVDFESGSLSVPIKVDFAGILIPENNLLDTGLHLKGFGTFQIKGQPTLTTEEREITQYVDDKAKLVKLIVAKQDQIFETDYYNNLTEKQIEIGNIEATIDIGELSFSIKVKVSPDSNIYLLGKKEVQWWDFSSFRLNDLNNSGNIELSSLTQEEKEMTQYVRDKTKLIKLIVAKQDQIFKTRYYNNLTENQIEIDGDVEAENGSLLFKMKVKANPNFNTYLLDKRTKLIGFITEITR